MSDVAHYLVGEPTVDHRIASTQAHARAERRSRTWDDTPGWMRLLDQLHPAWHQQASCNDRAELAKVGILWERRMRWFFPNETSSTRTRLMARQVKQVCAGCPVRVECSAAGSKERFGVWGGRFVERGRGGAKTLWEDA